MGQRTDACGRGQGLAAEAQAALILRDYGTQTFAKQLAGVGIEAGKLASADRTNAEIREAWIPGVEVFSRTIYPQRHRGSFGEFVRRDEGVLARIGFWPAQWANARMFAQTAKGFHVHPPSVPEGADAAEWLQRCFVQEPENYSLRRYEHERLMVARLAELDGLKRDFIANVSHELRTPLTVIQGMGKTLDKRWADMNDETRAELLGRVNRNADVLAATINTLLDFSQLEAGRLNTRIEPFDLGELVRRSVDRLATLFGSREVSISTYNFLAGAGS